MGEFIIYMGRKKRMWDKNLKLKVNAFTLLEWYIQRKIFLDIIRMNTQGYVNVKYMDGWLVKAKHTLVSKGNYQEMHSHSPFSTAKDNNANLKELPYLSYKF